MRRPLAFASASSSNMIKTAVTACPRRFSMPRVRAVVVVTTARMAITVASRGIRLAAWMISRLMKIEQQRRAHNRGRLVNLAMQHTGPRGGPPVDAVQRIAQFIRPHPGYARRILEKAVRQAHLADRPARRQVVP